MVSIQRRRGHLVTIFPSKTVTDSRSNSLDVVDWDTPHILRAAVIPQRSAKAEVPGQLAINVVRLICRADIPDVTLQSRVVWDGRHWDIAAPPSLHTGTRATRHWSIDIRERPGGG